MWFMFDWRRGNAKDRNEPRRIAMKYKRSPSCFHWDFCGRSGAMYYAKLHDSYGRVIYFRTYLKAFSDELESRGELLKTTTIDIPFSGKLFWKLLHEEIAVEKISITGFFTKTDSSAQRLFLLTDQVWMIMKDLFDKRKLTLSKNGLIWNQPSV